MKVGSAQLCVYTDVNTKTVCSRCVKKKIKPTLYLKLLSDYCMCIVSPSTVKMVKIHMEPLVCDTKCGTDVGDLLF